MRSLVLLAACSAPPTLAPTPHQPQPAKAFDLTKLVGGWQWQLATDEQGTSRTEREQWRFAPIVGDATHLQGRYVRDVEVRSVDGQPFACNQRTSYRQRAVFDVRLAQTSAGFAIDELAYRAEASPCDHGFRHMSGYTAALTGEALALKFEGGTQTLARVDHRDDALPEPAWRDHPDPYGPWRWEATSYDEAGNLRDEAEWWELTRRNEKTLDGTYRRRVTVRSPDGTPLPCANAPSYTFDDAYVLTGQREEEHWHLTEVADAPGDHPCIAPTPHRTLDEATAEQIGDYFVLEWRGKRREILYRPAYTRAQ